LALPDQRVSPDVTPPGLLVALQAIYPSFAEDWYTDNSFGYEDDTFPFHPVFMEFCMFFGVAAPAATEQQLLATAKLINEAVDAGGDLENAVSTGLLEHLHQIEAAKYLLPHLSERAKRELRG
jgi:hypothetical protein